MDKTLKVQQQIRLNAEEVSSYLTDLAKWEKTMKTKESNLKGKPLSSSNVPAVAGKSDSSGSKKVAVRSGSGTVNVSAATPSPTASNEIIGQGSASNHTYDKGYKKWEQFDIDAALSEVTIEEQQHRLQHKPSEIGIPSAGLGFNILISISK